MQQLYVSRRKFEFHLIFLNRFYGVPSQIPVLDVPVFNNRVSKDPMSGGLQRSAFKWMGPAPFPIF